MSIQYNVCTVQRLYSTMSVQNNVCTVQCLQSTMSVQYNVCERNCFFSKNKKKLSTTNKSKTYKEKKLSLKNILCNEMCHFISNYHIPLRLASGLGKMFQKTQNVKFSAIFGKPRNLRYVSVLVDQCGHGFKGRVTLNGIGRIYLSFITDWNLQ